MTVSIGQKCCRKYRTPIRHGWNATRDRHTTPGIATISTTEEAMIIAGMTTTSGKTTTGITMIVVEITITTTEEAIKSRIKSSKDITITTETEAGTTLTATIEESHNANDVRSHIMY